MATALTNPAKMIERGAPRLIHTDAELERYTSELFRLSEIERPSEFEAGSHGAARDADREV